MSFPLKWATSSNGSCRTGCDRRWRARIRTPSPLRWRARKRKHSLVRPSTDGRRKVRMRTRGLRLRGGGDESDDLSCAPLSITPSLKRWPPSCTLSADFIVCHRTRTRCDLCQRRRPGSEMASVVLIGARCLRAVSTPTVRRATIMGAPGATPALCLPHVTRWKRPSSFRRRFLRATCRIRPPRMIPPRIIPPRPRRPPHPRRPPPSTAAAPSRLRRLRSSPSGARTAARRQRVRLGGVWGSAAAQVAP